MNATIPTDGALVVVPEQPAALIRHSTDVAGVCREVVLKTACSIRGKKYVKVEGWQTIATAHGCVASSRDVERVEPRDGGDVGGYRAIGELRRISDGTLIATAEGFVGDDEEVWRNRNAYAKRGMAQTRAVSRVCRGAFAHVVVMIDAGLSTTPAEEVPSEDDPPPREGPVHAPGSIPGEKTTNGPAFDAGKAKTAAEAILHSAAEGGAVAYEKQFRLLSEQQQKLFSDAECAQIETLASESDRAMMRQIAPRGAYALKDFWSELPAWSRKLLEAEKNRLKGGGA